jgi:hypothetical protein
MYRNFYKNAVTTAFRLEWWNTGRLEGWVEEDVIEGGQHQFFSPSQTHYSSIPPFHLPPENEEEGGYSNCEPCSLCSNPLTHVRTADQPTLTCLPVVPEFFSLQGNEWLSGTTILWRLHILSAIFVDEGLLSLQSSLQSKKSTLFLLLCIL